jgi:hypothetical protein
LSLKKLVYLDGQTAVLYRSRMNPSRGRNFEAMDPLEWLARLADHIPNPGRHRTHLYAHLYAHYANRVRGERPPEEVRSHGDEAEQPKKRPCSPSWARLIAKVFQADPVVLQKLRRAAQGRGLRHRFRRHPPDPGPSRPHSPGEATS